MATERDDLTKEIEMNKLNFVSTQKGFVSEADGFLCHILPVVVEGALIYRTLIQSGGGWTSRGGENVVIHHDATNSFSPASAEQQIHDALEAFVSEEWAGQNQGGIITGTLPITITY
jgi:hypothetical protein